MRITHDDSKGGRWVFEIPCHPLQANMVVRFLRHLRNLGNAESRGILRPTDYIQGVQDLSRDIENTVLRALAARFPIQK